MGCPEGDTWSVVAMVLINSTWINRLKSLIQQVGASAFADNWSWWAPSLIEPRPPLHLTKTLGEWLGLSIDWGKTWAWSSKAGGARVMQQAVQEVFPQAQVQVQINACDLGCPTTYHGVAKLGKLQERFEGAKSKLNRIQQAHWSLDTKIHMVCSSVLPGAFYGCELVAIGQQHLDTLRVSVAHALLGERSHSMNSAIFLNCASIQHLDPHMYVLWRAVKAAQQFLQRCDASLRDVFLRMLATPSKVAGQSHGPASALREYFLRLGIISAPNGDIQVTAYRTCNLVYNHTQKRTYAVLAGGLARSAFANAHTP